MSIPPRWVVFWFEPPPQPLWKFQLGTVLSFFETQPSWNYGVHVDIFWNHTMCGSRKYPYPPHGRDWNFQGGGGVKGPGKS